MKNILIVGGSSGIGLSILKSNINENYVYNISRTKPEVVSENLTHYNCDVLNDELPKIDKIDTLIYCPGSINLKPINLLKEDDFRKDFEINVMGAVKTIKFYLNKLKESSCPNILMFSTVATKLGMPFHSSVAISKAGVEGLTKSLAAELAPKIKVNAIAPTIANTPLASKILRNEKAIDAIKERHPLKEILDPDNIAKLANFIVSNQNSSITGQIFPIDSGIVSIKL
jgi:3-oxoacyl-[acyl-carrier protein] reductase